MSLDAIEAEFKNGCSEDFSKDDFMFWKKRGAFRKKAGSEFEQLVHFRILDIGSFIVEPSYSIRHIEVERIFHNAMQTPKKFADMTSVVWPRAGLLIPNVGKDFVIELATESITDSITNFLNIYRDYGASFLSQHSSLEELDRVLNNAPLDPCPFQPSPLHRCGFGIIVAKMLHGSAAKATIESHCSVVEKLDGGFHMPKIHDLVGAVSMLA
ncbi:MAG: hypothetical protein AAFV88_03970 [Planctomycetota bacterium]